MGFFTSLLSPFFSKVFISIDIDASLCHLRVVRVKDGVIKEKISKEFKAKDGNIPMDAIKLIYNYRKKHPFTYVSAMLKTLSQGVLDKKHNKYSREISMGKLKLSECENISKDGLLFYAKRSTIKDFLPNYDSIGGIDFLFSPFLFMCHNIRRNPSPGRNLYVLLQKNNIALMIVKDNAILFSNIFLVSSGIEVVSKDQNKHTLNATNYSELENISDFDTLSKLDFKPSLDHLQTDLFIPNVNEEENKNAQSDMLKAKTIAKIISDSLKEYYQNPAYKDSNFVDRIIFLDACKIDNDEFSFIAKELLIESVKRDFDLLGMLIDFARTEIGESR